MEDKGRANIVLCCESAVHWDRQTEEKVFRFQNCISSKTQYARTYLEELVDVQVIAAIEVHEVQSVVDVCKSLLTVLAHHSVEQGTALVELLPRYAL